MPVAIGTILDDWSDGKRQHVIGTLTLSGNYTAGGDVLSFANIRIKSQRAPKWVHFKSTLGYIYTWVRATNKIIIRAQDPTNVATGIVNLEEIITATAYTAQSGVDLTTDVIEFYAIFDQLR